MLNIQIRAFPALIGALCGLAIAETPLAIKDLPQAVQRCIQENAKGAEVKHVSKEIEHGATQYEVETILNGKHRDFDVDPQGTLLVVEEEASLDALPAAAKAAILKAAQGSKLSSIERATRPGKDAYYEAAYADKQGKHEIAVAADGSRIKE